MILSNEHHSTYNFRFELVESLLKEHDVIMVLPYGDKVDKFTEIGATFHNINLQGRSTNPFHDIMLSIITNVL